VGYESESRGAMVVLGGEFQEGVRFIKPSLSPFHNDSIFQMRIALQLIGTSEQITKSQIVRYESLPEITMRLHYNGRELIMYWC
jgi:hypothetical protein